MVQDPRLDLQLAGYRERWDDLHGFIDLGKRSEQASKRARHTYRELWRI